MAKGVYHQPILTYLYIYIYIYIMAKGAPKKVKKGTPPPVDKLLKPAIGVALALVAYQFIRGLGSGVS